MKEAKGEKLKKKHLFYPLIQLCSCATTHSHTTHYLMNYFFPILTHSDFNTPGDILIMGSRQVIIVIRKFVLVTNVLDMCYYFGQDSTMYFKIRKKVLDTY